MQYLTSKDAKVFPPKKSGHKGDNGKVLVIGGSADFVGAPYLSAVAALKIGADYVAIACPEKVGFAINALSPDIITKKYDCEYFSLKQAKDVLDYAKNFNAVLIGNGLSDKKESLEFAKEVVKKIRKPLVIDADALKIIRLQDTTGAVFTPHKKEYEMLIKNSKASNLKKVIGSNVIIKKGPVDEIITREKVFYNKTGCDRMAVAGTGDVLAGLVLGLLGKRCSPLDAAKKAAYINGRLGEAAKKDFGDHFTASDMLSYIKESIIQS